MPAWVWRDVRFLFVYRFLTSVKDVRHDVADVV